MPIHLGFLRAINVGKRPFPMARLRAVAAEAGFDPVETHIQTGNLRVGSPMRSQAKVAAVLEQAFLADRGFEVPTIVLSPAELGDIVATAERLSAEHPPEYGHYVSLLREPVTDQAAALVAGLSRDGETVVAAGRAVHLLYDRPFHQAKVSGAVIERTVGLATNRNLRVLRTLAEKWAP